MIAGAHDTQIASGGGVVQHLLDSTDSGDATRIYVDNNDRVFLERRMQDYDSEALGRVELTDPPSSQILVSCVTARLPRASPLRGGLSSTSTRAPRPGPPRARVAPTDGWIFASPPAPSV